VSYDLAFWRQDESDERPSRELYELFIERQRVNGIPELPVEAFLARLRQAFPSTVREPNGDVEWLDWRSQDDQSSFQVEWTPQCVWVSLRPLDGDRANRIIDMANEFGCALYDPQTDERFGRPQDSRSGVIP
jgi:hypothetical protein